MGRPPSGTVSLLFTDIEGSTRLLQHLKDAYVDALDDYRRIIRAALARHGGAEVDTQGDSFFAAFPTAEAAVRAATDAQLALAKHRWAGGVEIRVRMGIHTGRPRALGDRYVGLDVHRAARVMAAAHGGQTLVTEATRTLLEGDHQFLDLGEHRLKDLLQAERLYQLLVEGLDNEFPAVKTLSNRPTNLPLQPNPLVGREEEVAQLVYLLRDGSVRLVTLSGVGGTGKTRLALQVAAELLDDFRSGSFFVSLAPVTNPDLVTPAIAQALSLRERPEEPLSATLLSHLEGKQMLLVLDNFEQVVDAAPFVADMLAVAPDVKVLVTSREPLHLRSERIIDVPPLSPEEALELFIARAQAVNPSFAPDPTDARNIREICARLDYLPLALELAAARVPLLPPRVLLDRLERRLPLLTTGPRDLPARQRTLSATIGWSYDLLRPTDQALFAALGVFVDGCTLEAAEGVCQAPLDGLQSLLDKNLLRRRDAVDGGPRFWMLETIREFALERLAESREAESIKRRHAEFFMQLAERGALELRGSEQSHWLARLDEEHDNIRAAIAWALKRGEAQLAYRLTGSMANRFWWVRGHVREAAAALEAAIALTAKPELTHVALVLDGAAWLALVGGKLDQARRYAEAQVEVSEALGDPKETARALRTLTLLAEAEGRPEEAIPLAKRELEISRELGNRDAISATLLNLGLFHLELDRAAEAVRFVEEALSEARAIHHEEGIGTCLLALGMAALHEGRHEDSLPLLVEALGISHALGFTERTGSALFCIAACRSAHGDELMAARLVGAADNLYESIGAVPEELERRVRGRLLAELARNLDASTLADAIAEGSHWSEEQAVALALESTGFDGSPTSMGEGASPGA
jgi:predicted ATPase/class 3 adenylate cyclase